MHLRSICVSLLLCCLALVGRGQTISSFSPTYGQVGDSVSITGSGFLSGGCASALYFNTQACPTGTWQVSDQFGTQISAFVPTGATTGPIKVQTCSGGQAISVQNFTVIGPGPYILNFSPTNAAVGTAVTINGAHFSASTVIKFNGATAAVNTPTTSSQITAFVPSAGTTGPITASDSNGSWTSSNNFYYPAGITNWTPSSGRPGTNVTIKGTNFVGTTSVLFNGLSASFTVNGNNQITATVPAGATTGKITISAPAGQFVTAGSFFVTPNITSFTPSSGAIGSSVTISGVNFGGSGLSVKFNNIGATVTANNATQITATVPSTTTGPITVQTSDGTSTTSSNFFLPPSISSISPTTGGVGASVSVTGQNFTGTTSVKFNGVSATSYTVVNNTSLNVTVPIGATSGPISVQTPGGSAQSLDTFFVAPIISSFNPHAGVIGVGVTIGGTNFLGTTNVYFNGATAVFSNINDNTLYAVVPNGATTGPITVRTYAGTAVTTSNFLVEPLVLSITNLDANTVQVSWTTNAPGFFLQSTTNLLNTSTPWVNEPVAPQIIGGKETVTNSNGLPRKFYRVRN